MEYIVIYCTVPNKKEGKTIAKKILDHKLAACVNIIDKIESVFLWDGKMSEEQEALMIIKTKKEMFEKIQFIIKDMHSYNVPEIIAMPILQGDEIYLKWIEHETSK